MEVFTRMVTTCTATGPLQNDGEIGVGCGDVDDLTNTFNGTGLEGDVLNPSIPQTFDDLGSLLRTWNTCGDTETFDWEPLTTHLLPERELEAKLAWVDVEGVQRDPNTGRDLALDLSDL